MHSVQYKGRLIKILILERILKKNSYERRVYESVDEKIILILSNVTKNNEKKRLHALMG